MSVGNFKNKKTMQNLIVNTIQFPEFNGIKCNMMPFIQGDNSSLPKEYQPYAKIINENYLKYGILKQKQNESNPHPLPSPMQKL